MNRPRRFIEDCLPRRSYGMRGFSLVDLARNFDAVLFPVAACFDVFLQLFVDKVLTLAVISGSLFFICSCSLTLVLQAQSIELATGFLD